MRLGRGESLSAGPDPRNKKKKIKWSQTYDNKNNINITLEAHSILSKEKSTLLKLFGPEINSRNGMIIYIYSLLVL
jgi:hypothetical protein